MIHTLYRNALITAIAQREKEEADAKKKAEEERRQKAQENRARRAQNQRGPIQSAIPVKQNQPVQMPSQQSSEGEARLGDITASELEDLFEEGL